MVFFKRPAEEKTRFSNKKADLVPELEQFFMP
jgi:hypothetical protein